MGAGPNNEFDNAQELAEALLIAWRRTRGVEPPFIQSVLNTERGRAAPSSVLRVGWSMRPTVSPFWRSETPEWWENTFLLRGWAMNVEGVRGIRQSICAANRAAGRRLHQSARRRR